MGNITNMMSKFNQIQLLCFWICDNTKYKIIDTFDGKKGEIHIKIYKSVTSIKPENIYKLDSIWVKSEAIVLKGMDNIIQHLLIIKTENEL
jgi:hypothetical protein